MFIGGFQLTSTEKKTKVSLSEGVVLAACIKYRKIKDETQRIVSIQNAKGSLFLNLPKTSKSLLFPAQFPILPRCRPEVIMQFSSISQVFRAKTRVVYTGYVLTFNFDFVE